MNMECVEYIHLQERLNKLNSEKKELVTRMHALKPQVMEFVKQTENGFHAQTESGNVMYITCPKPSFRFIAISQEFLLKMLHMCMVQFMEKIHHPIEEEELNSITCKMVDFIWSQRIKIKTDNTVLCRPPTVKKRKKKTSEPPLEPPSLEEEYD